MVNGVFENVDRHNGLEAWCRIVEPINDDKLLILQELLAPATNPRGAPNLGGLPQRWSLGHEHPAVQGGGRT